MSEKTIKILAIDDHHSNLNLLKGMLADYFPSVKFLGALSGSEGISLCIKEKPDTILLDIMMPEMDGFEVCRRVKADKNLRHIPVVMLTALMDEKPIRIKALDAGADSFIAKPIDQSEFIAQIRAMLRIKESEDHKIQEHQLLETEVQKRTEDLNKELAQRRRAEMELKAANEDLKNNQKINESLMKELKAEIKERLQAEIRVHEHLEEQKLLSEFSGKLVSLNNLDDVYQYVGQKIFENIDDAYVLVTIYNVHNKTISVKFVFGIDQYREKIKKIFGFDPFMREISNFNYSSGELANFRKQMFFEPGADGLHFLFARDLNLDLCRETEAVLGVKNIYIMGFTFGKKVYGGISILTKDGHTESKMRLFEPMINQVSVALQRLFVEEKLHISEKLYRTLVETSPDGIVMSDLKGMPLALNKRVYEIFGYDVDDIRFSETNIIDYISTGDRDRSRENYAKRLTGESIPDQEYYAVHKDGSEFPIEVNSSLVLDENEMPYAIIYIIRDITKRKQVEKALMENRELYKVLADKMTDVVWLMDLDGKSVFVSPSIKRFTGFSEDEYLKQTFEERFTRDSAEYGKKVFSEEIKRLKEAPEKITDYSITTQMEYMCKNNNRTKWGELVITPLYSNDELIGIHGVTRDITERRRAEKALKESEYKYQFIVENTDDILWIMDGNFKLEYVTPSVFKFLGYTVEEHMKQTFDDFLAPASVTLISDEFMEGMINLNAGQYDKLRNKSELEVEFIRKDNTIGYARVAMIMVRDELYGITKIRGITTDITTRKLNEIYEEISKDVLQVLNEQIEFQDRIGRITEVLKSRAGFDAVGIRLHDGGDFPYFAQIGFSKDFLMTENSLISSKDLGRLCNNKEGNCFLDCFCGLVLSGKTNPDDPVYTKGGSFRTNDSVMLLGDCTGQDSRIHARNRCIYQGYASLALIPIRVKDEIVGLIQMNDRRKGRFTPEVIQYLEGIALHIGTALLRKQTETSLKESEEKYRLLARNMVDVLSLIDRSGKIVYINDSAYNHLGYKPEFMLGKDIWRFLFNEDKNNIRGLIKKSLLPDAISESLVLKAKKKNKGFIWLDSNILFLKNDNGKIIGYQCVSRDISGKIETENRLEAERQKVMSAIIDGQELERHRLSMDMHDGLGQRLAGIKIKLENLSKYEMEETRRTIQEVKSEFREVIEEIRSMSMNVSPTILSDLGLVAAITLLGNRFKENNKIEFDYSVLGDFDHFPAKKALNIYRIVQEGLNNIAKHAKATITKLALIEKEGFILILLEDNGVGFNQEKVNFSKGNGLSNMRQRTLMLNGDFNIETGINSGTILMIKIPK